MKVLITFRYVSYIFSALRNVVDNPESLSILPMPVLGIEIANYYLIGLILLMKIILILDIFDGSLKGPLCCRQLGDELFKHVLHGFFWPAGCPWA